MRSAFSPGEKKGDKKNLAVLEKRQEAAAFSSDDLFVYTIGEPISDLDAAPYGAQDFLSKLASMAACLLDSIKSLLRPGYPGCSDSPVLLA